MFRFKKGLEKLELPAQRVVRIMRSTIDVQVAQPGHPSQESTAYLCIFTSGAGLRAAVAFHLKKSEALVFYLNEEGEVERGKAEGLEDEGVRFAESMGFVLSDLDFAKLDGAEREKLWLSLPLKKGVGPPAPPQKAPEPAPEAKKEPEPIVLAEAQVVEVPEPPTPAETKAPPVAPPPAVEAAPENREQELKKMRENLGRFLGSF